jgi:dipeptidase
MCDTLIACAEVTKNNTAIFAKNSDRPPNEAQYLTWLPAQSHSEGEKVQCTYLEIPQVKETIAVLLSKPFWMWGGELGVNEYGLAIGNEAIFSKTDFEIDVGSEKYHQLYESGKQAARSFFGTEA